MADPRDISSAKLGVAVTPHASSLIEKTRAVYIGTAGDVAVVWADAPDNAAAVVMKSVAAGVEKPWSVKAIRVAGTTATDIVALY